MKHFTPELILRIASLDPDVANAADAEWDRRLEEYEQYVGQILPTLPEHVRQYHELLLHDANVWCMTREGATLTIIMRKDIPPRDVVQVNYTLAAEPMIDPAALPREPYSKGMQYLYNEFDLVEEDGRALYTESILFSNGWEMQLKYSDVQVALAQAIYPVPDSPAPPLAQSA